MFYHLAKAAGHSLRKAVVKAARVWRLEATVPCHGRPELSCSCQENYYFHNYNEHCRDKQTGKPIDLSKSAVIAGHFSPRGVLSRRSLDQSAYTCYTMLRDPVNRAISHYTFFPNRWKTKQISNTTIERPFSDLSLEEVEAFVDRQNPSTIYIKRTRNNCAKEGATKILDAAKQMVDTCVVGVIEEYEGSLAFLTLVYPWLGKYSDLGSIHTKPTKHVKSAQLPPAIAALMRRHYDVEYKLHNYTESKLRRQVLAATRCMSLGTRWRSPAGLILPPMSS